MPRADDAYGRQDQNRTSIPQELTEPELWLWLRLKSRSDEGLVFRNQHPIGPYILDFYCARAKLCIEVDGADHTRDDRIARDAVRDAVLADMGIYTYRITGGDVLEDPDEAANGVVLVALERIALLATNA
jgi:very-short-patch-repair endonuclease